MTNSKDEADSNIETGEDSPPDAGREDPIPADTPPPHRHDPGTTGSANATRSGFLSGVTWRDWTFLIVTLGLSAAVMVALYQASHSQWNPPIRDLEASVNELQHRQRETDAQIDLVRQTVLDILPDHEAYIDQLEERVTHSVTSGLKQLEKVEQQLVEHQDQFSGRIQELQSATEVGMSQIETKMTQVTARMAAQDVALRQELDALTWSIKTLQHQIQDSTRYWTLREVEHLLVIANQRARLADDVSGARIALQIAAQQLGQLEDNHYRSVRQSIQTTIDSLDQVPSPDWERIAREIHHLTQQLASLPMRGVPSPSEPVGLVESDSAHGAEATDSSSSTGAWIANMGKAFLSDLGELVQVEKDGEPIMPPLSPEMRRMIEERGMLLLEGVHMALMRRDVGAFRERLDTAENWVRERYDDNHPATVEWLQQIPYLRTLYPEMTIPDISLPLGALRELMRVGT